MTPDQLFELCFEHSTKAEGRGEYSNDPADRGGETYWGIARNKRPDWDGWRLVDAAKGKPDFPACLVKDPFLTAIVKEDYHINYFNRLGLGTMPVRIAMELFDTALNQGSGAAAQHLQRALNVLNRGGKDYADLEVDGDMGPATHQALASLIKARGGAGTDALWKILNVLQGNRYISIIEKDPSQERYALGWMGRVFETQA